MKASKYPTWWDCSIDFAWNHIKLGMKQDWNRIKNRLARHSSKIEAATDDDAEPTNGVKILLAAGNTMFDELESAFRFGYSARMEYDTEWNDNLEVALAKEWRAMNPLRAQTWEQDRQAILYGWNFETEAAEQAMEPATERRPELDSNYFDTAISPGEMLAA